MLSDLRYRLRALFRPGAVERELDSELRFHLDKQIATEMAAGASRDEAERRARLLFGGIEQVKEDARDSRGISPIEILIRDLRYAVRLLAKSPGFTAIAIISLTLGIGANTAMFQLLNALVLAPLPVPQPYELVEIQMNDADLDRARGSFSQYPSLTYPILERLRERQQAFTGLIAWGNETFNLAPSGEIRRGRGLWVSGDFFTTLGVQPLLGRLFTAADDHRGCGMPGAVVSYEYWQHDLAGDPTAIGRTLTVNAQRVDVIGVTPPGFFGLEVGRTFDVALPICSIAVTRPADDALNNGVIWWLKVVGRLKPGWTPPAADAHIRGLSAAVLRDSLPRNYPPASVKEYLASTFVTESASGGISSLRGRYQAPLQLLLAMTALVLLIACANLANLMITRGVVRSRELALRLALGASRGRLFSQLLSESLLIAAISALGGLVLARVLSTSLVTLMGTTRNPITLGLPLDWRVFAFTAGTAALTCLLLGLAPALRATRGSPGDVLKAGSRGVTRDRESLTLRRSLLVAQVAISLVLVVGALLFIGTFRNLVNTPLGFQQDHVLSLDAGLPPPSPSDDASRALKRTIRERLATVPGVQSVAEASVVPLSGQGMNNRLWLDGDSRSNAHETWLNSVSPDFFRTMGIPVLAGRDVSEQDRRNSPRVAVVNESFARVFTGGRSPIGRRFWIEQTSGTPEALYEIVGVVRDSKYKELREEQMPHAFFAIDQSLGTPRPGGTFLVRTAIAPADMSGAIGKALLDVNPNLRFITRVLDGAIRDTLIRERVMATLSALFGGLAVLLAAVGLHGIISYSVERRRREIGIRMALGASRGIIVQSVLHDSGKWVGIGLTLGVLASLALTRTAQALLYGVQPGDPATIAIALAGLAMVALFASYLPALQAARVDPMTTLKEE